MNTETKGLTERLRHRNIGVDCTSLLNGKHVLVIGSGRDLDGRKLGNAIDSGKWDTVVRVNKLYGGPEDVGTRTDIIVTRWTSWLKDHKDWFSDDVQRDAKGIIVLNEFKGYTKDEYRALCDSLDHCMASGGIQAVSYCLNRGAKVDVIGFGFKDGKHGGKVYTQANTAHIPKHLVDNSGKDLNNSYDWDKEDAWLANHPDVTLL